MPKLVVPFTPTIEEVPLLVILPEANGAPAEGRTRTFCQVKEFLTPLLVKSVTVKVICAVVILVIAKLVPLATLLIFLVFGPLPAMRVTKTVGAVPPVSKINPEGTFKIIVPMPMSAVTPSEITGPVKAV